MPHNKDDLDNEKSSSTRSFAIYAIVQGGLFCARRHVQHISVSAFVRLSSESASDSVVVFTRLTHLFCTLSGSRCLSIVLYAVISNAVNLCMASSLSRLASVQSYRPYQSRCKPLLYLLYKSRVFLQPLE